MRTHKEQFPSLRHIAIAWVIVVFAAYIKVVQKAVRTYRRIKRRSAGQKTKRAGRYRR